MLVLLGIGFLAGVVTAISPCVLPVLPILLAGGASGRKPLRIVAGLVASFTVFTLFAAWLLDQLGLPQDFLRNARDRPALRDRRDAARPARGAPARAAARASSRASGRAASAAASSSARRSGSSSCPCAGPVLATITVVAANNARRPARDPAHARLRDRRRACRCSLIALRRRARRRPPAAARRDRCASAPAP